MTLAKPWPFDQPRNAAAITTRQVLGGMEPVLLVSHDAEDSDWQFIGRTDGETTNGRVVSMEEIVQLDPTLLEVADLPPGWLATRNGIGERWTRRPNEGRESGSAGA